ncbi:MAG TPA: sigma-70 family RNA polymerase sigma factor [Coleofasciculaceae cyanobacterium]|jgi:RNA polymerase sigma factor (sigma-70 family)
MAARQPIMTFKSSSNPEKKPKKTVNDYVDLIETVARVEYSRLPNHLIDFSEVVNIGAIAIHVLLTSNPDREFNVTYLSTAIKWAIRNELRYRYKWYSLKQVSMDNSQDDASGDGEGGEGAGSGFEAEKGKVREAVYETILSVDGMMESENPHEIKDSAYTPEESTEVKEMAKVVRDAIAKLPPREKEIIEARFFKNMKMREIGETFNISPSRTSRIVQSGLDKIKVELQRRGYNPTFT